MTRLDPHRYARETHVVDLPDGVTIVVAHAGQPLNTDAKYLKEHFGLDVAKGFSLDRIVPLSQSQAAPLTAEQKAAERAETQPAPAAMPKTAREMELEAENAKLRELLAKAAGPEGRPARQAPPPPRTT